MSDSAAQDPQPRRGLSLPAIGLLLIAGLIHLLLTPEHLEEATYLGLLFIANFAGAAVAAFGLYRGHRWGWVLGILVAGGAYLLYFVSTTVGLPGVEEGHLLEPASIFAKVIEALFLVLCAFEFTGAFSSSRRWALGIGVAALLLVVVPGLALALGPHEAHEKHTPEHHH